MADVVGSISVTATLDTSNYTSGANTIIRSNSEIEDSSNNSSQKVTKSWSTMAAVAGAVGGVVSTVVSKAFDAVTSSVGDAIKRVDTLNNATRTFENMGFSAKATASMMATLQKSIQGLPTTLDEAVSGVELLSSATGNLGQSQKVYKAMNDAILGFGGSSADVSNAVRQLSQDLAGGKIQAETWNSMLDSGLGPTLNAIAKTMGMTTQQLKDGLSSGKVSVQQFQDALVNLDTKGGGGLRSLSKIAADSTAGIGTGMTNARTAIVKGIADIITAIGTGDISSTISNIGSAFKGLLDAIAGVITFVKSNWTVFGPLIVALGTITVAVGIATKAMALFGAVMAVNPIALVVIAIAALAAGLVYFFTQTETGQKIWSDFVSFIGNAVGTIGGFFASAWSFISGIWGGVVGFFAGIWNGIVAVFSGVYGFFSSIFSGGANGVRSAFSSIAGFFYWVWNAIMGVFRGVGGWFSGAFSGARNAIIGVFSGAGGWLVGAGANIINGLRNGISSAIGGVISAVSGVASKISSTVRRILGIHSPSKVFAEIGDYMMKGWSIGISDNSNLPVDSTTNVAQTIADPLSYITDPSSQNSLTNNIGTINIGSELDGQNWLEKLTRQSELADGGLV